MSNFSETISDLIEEHKLSVVEFGQIAGVSTATVYRWLAKTSMGETSNLIKIADKFDLSIDYILGLSFSKKFLHSTQNENCYTRIQKLKNSKSIGYKDFSRLFNISDGNLSKWKNGRLPNVETLIALAEYFGCSVDYVLGRAD